MPDSRLLLVSFLCVIIGGTFFLFPKILTSLSQRLNTSHGTLDQWIIRCRYIIGVLAFVAGYGFFRLALLLPTLGR